MPSNQLTISYGDRVATLALWWKSFFLFPIWAVLVIPLVGAFFRLFGDLSVQIGYAVVLIALIAYFVEDVLKRKIRIEDDYLFWGYRCFKMLDLVSVGVKYKGNQILPSHMVFVFGSAKRLELKLSRLKQQDFESLLKFVQTRVPHCKIDPVLDNVTKCRKIARTTLLEKEDKVEVEYHSRRFLKELYDTFTSTADKWTRAGPVITCTVFTFVWTQAVTGLFLSLLTIKNAIPKDELALKEMLVAVSTKCYEGGGKLLADWSKTLYDAASHPAVACACGVILVYLIINFLRLLLRPNIISLDKTALSLNFRFGTNTMPVSRLPWETVKKASLVKPGNTADSKHWKVRFEKENGKNFDLDLTAIESQSRSKLVKCLEKWAPNCHVDAELTEAMQPKQERSYTELWLQSLSSAPERKSLEPLAPGQMLQEGQFEVIRRLGIGGQGMAYLCATPLKEAPNVVLKETILPLYVEHTIREQALERFQQEAQLLKQLQSPHIVKLLDYFVEDHRGYIVLEHVDGKTLRQLVKEEGPLSEERAKGIATQMCDILQYLHSQNIIHRDFTPDNVILRKDGTLTLIDFNVAQQVSAGTTGTIVGTHCYLPPEQFRGKPTFQSDIYAMGATLFFLITGEDPEPISQSSLRSVKNDISDMFENLVSKCTMLSLNTRFKSVADIREGLGLAPVDAGQETNADPTSKEAAEQSVVETPQDDNGSTISLSESKEKVPIKQRTADG